MNEFRNNLFLGITDKIEYPNDNSYFSPQEEYPEYGFAESKLTSENKIYDLIREGFHSLGFDKQNYGTKNWNPLSHLIKPGDTVLLKPNWVMHFNKNLKYSKNLDCLITHPSITRAVIDYALIALNGTGRLIIADAPMQGCNLNEMFNRTSYSKLFDFYKKEGKKIEIMDLRHVRVITQNKVITDTLEVNKPDQSITIDLGKLSEHSDKSNLRYKVSDYTERKTNEYHNADKHSYNINKNVLLADVIINLPKPKCHRLAGITAAQKNLVGIIFDKSSLPHRAIGSQQEGGDEYSKKSYFKSLYSSLEEKKLILTEQRKTKLALIIQFMIALIYAKVKFIDKDKVMIGSWFGNDTIWRTVTDLNIIVKFADKNGTIRNTPQRKIFNIADMIISGQGNGPIGPHPKSLGMILMCEDSVYLDLVCTRIMGFDSTKIPGLTSTLKKQSLNNTGQKMILSNIPNYNNLLFDDFNPLPKWKFDPHDAWKGSIETNN